MSVRRLAAAALLTLTVLGSVRAQGKTANKSIPIHPVKLKKNTLFQQSTL